MQATAVYPPLAFNPVQPLRDARTSGKLTGSGVILFLSGLLVLGSGFESIRPSMLGLRIHPYLVPIGLAFPFLVLSRSSRFPTNTLVGLCVFTGIYIFSMLSGTYTKTETPKILLAGASIFSAALLVRTRNDAVAGALGLSIAVGALAWKGLQGEGDVAEAAMDLSNKNAYSLYALPSILMGCYFVLNFPMKNWVKAIFLMASTLAIVTIFSSGNRSGYLGVLVVGLMLLKGRKVFGIFLVMSVAIVVSALLVRLGTADVATERLERTGEMQSDRDRWSMFVHSVQVGLENPIIGVSLDGLMGELGNRLGYGRGIDPHNVFASIIGGSGIICSLALAYVAWSICNIAPAKGFAASGDEFFRQSRRLARMLVILWCVRGAFTREILYNPSFCLALGLVIGLCLVAGGRVRPPGQNRHAVTYAQA